MKKSLLGEILSKYHIEHKESLDELSEKELDSVLYELMCIDVSERNEENIILTKEVLKKIYTKKEAQFYCEIMDYIYEKKDENELIIKYADSEYNNEIFCITGRKIFWDIEAKILIKRGYPRIKDVLSKMFVWLQDVNWPGALEIKKFLSSIDKEIIIPHLEEVTITAIKENDIVWLYWLREFMEDNGYKREDFKNKDIYEVLKDSTDM